MNAAWMGLAGVVVGAAIVGGTTLLGVRTAARRAERAALLERQTTAYSAFISACGLIALMADTTRQLIAFRSGVKESLGQVTGSRSTVDPVSISEFFRRDVDPLYRAWSEVWAIGSPEAVRLANNIVDQANRLIAKGSEPGKARGAAATTILGQAWTGDQQGAFQADLKKLSSLRRDFAALARKETGRPVAELFRPPSSSDSG